MGAETAGRKLGIGLRLAARFARERTSQPSGASPPVVAGAPTVPGVASQAASQAKVKAKNIGRGTKRFGEAVVGPIAHTGGVLWLEITGLFFGLFAAYFGQSVYKFRDSFISASGRHHYVIFSWLTLYVAFTLLFAFFSISAFLRAHLKEKKNRARRAKLARS